MPDTPQTRAPAYRLAFADPDFLTRDELRPVRLQLELLKPQMVLDERGIRSTVVLFGGARIPTPRTATRRDRAAGALARYYDEAREFARLVHREQPATGYARECDRAPAAARAIMEAGNRGAQDAGGQSDRPQHRAAARTGAEPPMSRRTSASTSTTSRSARCTS